MRKAVLFVGSDKVTRYLRLSICPSPGESRRSERRSGGTPAARSSSLPSPSLATGRRPLSRADWLCSRPSASVVSDLNACNSWLCSDSKLALFGAFSLACQLVRRFRSQAASRIGPGDARSGSTRSPANPARQAVNMLRNATLSRGFKNSARHVFGARQYEFGSYV